MYVYSSLSVVIEHFIMVATFRIKWYLFKIVYGTDPAINVTAHYI